MKELLYVFLGGGMGSVLRYMASALWMHLRLHPSFSTVIFPWPTFCVNVLGAFLIGLFYTKAEAWGLSAEARLLLTTGLCGGFTTFSTFSWESMNLIRTGNTQVAILYILLSLILGIVAVAIPVLLFRQ